MASAGSPPRRRAGRASRSKSRPEEEKKKTFRQLLPFRIPFNTQRITHQILPLQVAHLLHDAPQPALELEQLVAAFVRLVVERRVRDERAHVNVADAVQQQPQVLRRQLVERRVGQHVKHPGPQRLQHKRLMN